ELPASLPHFAPRPASVNGLQVPKESRKDSMDSMLAKLHPAEPESALIVDCDHNPPPFNEPKPSIIRFVPRTCSNAVGQSQRGMLGRDDEPKPAAAPGNRRFSLSNDDIRSVISMGSSSHHSPRARQVLVSSRRNSDSLRGRQVTVTLPGES